MAARLRSLLGRLAPATIAESRSLAARLPGLLVEAREVAGAVAAGWHGRRQAGSLKIAAIAQNNFDKSPSNSAPARIKRLRAV